MKNKVMKRWLAGMCAAVLAAMPTMGVFAADETELTINGNGNTEVTAQVTDEGTSPAYIVSIPKKVDFGQLYIPTSAGTDYKTIDITVKCVKADNLKQGDTVAVLVKDSRATGKESPFQLLKDGSDTNHTLDYEMLAGDNNIKDSSKWYENGFLFNAFTGAGQSTTNVLRLDRGQLFDKDITTWGGAYSGQLRFYVRLASINDAQ